MKTKKARIRTSWTAALAALGASAVLLPAQAQYQPGSAGAQPPTSTHQPEMSNAPGPQGWQGRDAAGAQGGASQWEQSRPPGSQGRGMAGPPEGSQQMPQGRDAGGGGMSGAQGAQGGMGTQQGMQTDQRALTREEVRAETEAWREAGLLDSMMYGDDSSSWVSPEEQQRRDQISREFQSQRGGMEPPGLGGGMGGGR